MIYLGLADFGRTALQDLQPYSLLEQWLQQARIGRKRSAFLEIFCFWEQIQIADYIAAQYSAVNHRRLDSGSN